MTDLESLRSWLGDHRDDVVDELAAWVRIPSIAGVAEHEADLARSADWLASALRELGFPVVEVWPADGNPCVFASWHVSDEAPTALIYSHHDVRTVHADQWDQPPFEPLRRGTRLVGRGASDAKGQVLAHLWALRALLADGSDTLPLNIKLIVEGEEEAGSPHLAKLLDEHAGDLAADLVMLTDTMTWAADRPAVCTGIRGMMKATLTIFGPDVDVHAGSVAGAAPNPLGELARVLARLHDADGTVAIEGFYDDVAEPTPDEQSALIALSTETEDWVERTSVRAVVGEADFALGELLYSRPAVDVLMLAAGEPEPPTSGTVPGSAKADIQLSLVADQDPNSIGELLRRWVGDTVAEPFRYDLDIAEAISQPPYLTPQDHPALGLLAQAMADAWECPVGRMRNAGSAPTALLAKLAPVLFFGTGLPEDHWHGPNESVDLDVLLKGALALALFWRRLAALRSP